MNEDPQAKDLVPFVGEPGLEDKAQKILEDTISEVGREAREKGGYYAVLTESQKSVVRMLVESNFNFYNERFKVDLYEFTEAMSENYLVKTRVFAPIVELAGFESHEEVGDVSFTKSTEMACLSVNGSYVMAGAGTVGSVEGGSITYTRLPLREGDTKAVNVHYDKGVRLTYVPERGDRFHAITPGAPLHTSALTEVYARNPDTSSGDTVDAVARTVTQSYTHIDRRTMSGFTPRE